MLAARAGGAVDLHFDILGADVHILRVVRDFGNHFHSRKRGLAAGVRVKGGDAHEPVHAVFALEKAIGVCALNENAGGFDACLVAVEIVENFVAQAVALDPVRVHAVEHLRPILRLRAACTGLE